jgi:hypothetical protein
MYIQLQDRGSRMEGTDKPSKAVTGAPRWTYVVGALVAAGGLIWGVISHFVDKQQAAPHVLTQEATSKGGTAIVANSGATVHVRGHGADTKTPIVPSSPVVPTVPSAPEGQQTADAGEGGVAIIADGPANVTVDAPTEHKQ